MLDCSSPSACPFSFRQQDTLFTVTRLLSRRRYGALQSDWSHAVRHLVNAVNTSYQLMQQSFSSVCVFVV